ncbi:MAG: glycosyltransferase family 39 protein, partial [Acidimicrobiales bacterium]
MAIGKPSSAWRRPILFLELTAFSLLVHLPGLIFALFSSDEASTATLAISILRGGRLYLTVADRKPPLVPYLYAGVFTITGTHDLRPVRVLGDLALAATAYILAREAGRRYGGRSIGLAVGLLFLIGSVALLPDSGQAATFEMFMVLPMTAAFVAAVRGRAVGAGVLLAVACLCKQTAIVSALPIAYLLIRERGWTSLLRAAVPGLGVLVATALAFGPSRFLLWNITGNGGYLAVDGGIGSIVLNAGGQIGPYLGANLVLLWLAGRARRLVPVCLDLWLWLAGGLVAVIVGLRFFDHYFLQILPALALLAGAGLASWTLPQRRRAIAGAALGPAVLVAVGFFPHWFNQEPDLARLVAVTDSLTGPQAPIFVWG